MKNKEKFQRTFSVLHASDNFLTEVTHMNTRKHFSSRRLVSISAAAVLVFVMATAAYAVDFGGIRKTFQLWIHGNQTDVAWESHNGQYTASYTDEDGTTHEISGGGVSIDEDGNERPATEDELLAHFDRPEVEYKVDGTVWVYYHNQSIEISDCFDEDGVCYILLEDGEEKQYLTIKYQGGFACRTDGYMPPEQFNVGK